MRLPAVPVDRFFVPARRIPPCCFAREARPTPRRAALPWALSDVLLLRLAPGIAGLAASAALLVAGLVVVARLPDSRALFRIIMASALTAVVTLAGAGSAILG